MNKRTPILTFVAIAALSSFAAGGENLLTNPSATGGTTNGWTIIANGGDGWATRGDSSDGDGACFITSYSWCRRSQTIDLIAEGYTPEFLDSSPQILVKESFKGFLSNYADNYYLRVELRDENGVVLESWEAGNQGAPLQANTEWVEQQHLFENYPSGVREIYWEDGGDDAEFWAGHYGTLLDGAELSFNDPVPTDLHLTPGTYPVGASAGDVAGVFTTDDNAGATHTYELVTETDTQFYVFESSFWRYLDDGSDQGTAWIAAGFDDSTWIEDISEMGYGENDEFTLLNGQNSHITNYMRHKFTVPAGGLNGLESLTLRLKRDDGAVVYLNGTEVVRDNLPAGAITFTTPATTAADDGQDFIEFPISPTLLLEGENVLAVEIHQDAIASDDMSFDLELAGEKVTNAFHNDLFTISGDQLLFAQDGPTLPVAIGNTYTVNVRSTDEGGGSIVKQLTVTGVADPSQAPTAIAVAPAEIFEAEPVGSVVGDLSATDADAGDYHEFSLVAGTGDTDNASFEIVGNRLVTRVIFDASVQTSASVRVRAVDRASMSVEMPLTITIRDLNDPPTDIFFTGVNIATNSPAGTLVGTLSTEDLDPVDTHTYSYVPTFSAEEIFGFGSEWRFLDDGSDQGTGWTNVFDDSAWNTGLGSFGYGDGQTTAVDFGGDTANKHTTTYFRRTFSLPNPGAYDNYRVSVRRDDGVIAYVNGTEAGRDNLGEFVDYLTFAEEAVGGVDEVNPVDFMVPASEFVVGNNVIAAEIHQATLTSSDLTFDLALSGLVDASGGAYFDIVNGNEIRTNAAFATANVPPGSTIDLVLRSTDSEGEMVERTFVLNVISDDPDDADGDTLPDSWELQYFPNIAGQNAQDDSDGDGLTNLEELIYDTLPNDPASVLGLEVLTTGGGNAHTVQWNSSDQCQYRLQSSTTLEPGSWIDTPAGQRTGTGGTMSESFPAGIPELYYRLEVVRP